MDSRPIGIFDSGLGGLTAFRELRRLLPLEKIVFLGDTLRLPYGGRDRETLNSFAKDDISFLLRNDVKYIIIACGTVSANISDELLNSVPVGITGVIKPAVAAAVSASRNKKVGVIATQASIRSGAYQKELCRLDSSISVTSVACPKFVPLIESGATFCSNTELMDAVREYLEPVRQADVDTLILGCTHYPLIADLIAEYLGPGVKLIDSGAASAAYASTGIRSLSISADRTEPVEPEFYVTSDPDRFSEMSSRFLGGTSHKAKLAVL